MNGLRFQTLVVVQNKADLIRYTKILGLHQSILLPKKREEMASLLLAKLVKTKVSMHSNALQSITNQLSKR
jgi:hypothetical protein